MAGWFYKNENFDSSVEWVDALTALFNNLLGSFYEQTDPVDDIDRIFRQQEAQEFQRILDGIATGETSWRDLAAFEVDFLSEIDGFQEYVDEAVASAQYTGLYDDLANASTNQDFQRIFNEYANAGIETNPYIQRDLASTGSATAVITGTVDNSILQQVIRDAALGDGILGGEVDFEDLPGYGGIWDGLIRHIKVIGRGINLPIPDWLPLPGIFELPTIGEIFDKVTGPWKTAAEDALRDCVATGKSASQCMEEQSVLDILVDGIGNATEGIWNETADAVQGILDETIDCASNPTTCAQEVFDKIKDIFGEGAVDPTATGGNIPDWLKVIIIGGAYGDEILGELEDLFGGDIDGDDLIGTPEDPTVTPPVTPEFDCASVFKSGGTVTDESQCGGCLQGYDPDGQGGCIEAPIECPGEQVYDELTGECKDPEPGFVEGDPCKTEAGESGTYDAEGACVADPVPVEECTDPNRNKNDDGSCADTCADGSPAPASGLCPEPVTPCENNATPESGCERCSDGSLPSEHENGDCSEPKTATSDPEGGEDGPPCDQPQPGGFEGVAWAYKCRDTHCSDGSLISDHPNNDCSIPIGTVIPEEGDPCDSNGDGNLDGTITNGECVAGVVDTSACDSQNRVTNEDGSCGECLPGFTPDPQGFDQCIQAPPECNDCSCAEYAAANPIECTTCPDGESYCASTGQCEPEGACPSDEEAEESSEGGVGGGFGGSGGRSMFAPLNPAITASPQLLTRQDFPITDFLAGIFTNSTGGTNV